MFPSWRIPAGIYVTINIDSKRRWKSAIEGDPVIISPPVCGVRPSLALKASLVHACDNQDDALFGSIVDCKIARDTDAGHARLAKYVSRKLKRVSRINNILLHFQSVLD
ncbi:hypothetical protein DEU56DRAFT_917980 [Suillus clintonianus]|uniref:uncharacterized protein n=1 Tax=Suillus clintonianus TaxID=1904413 RepID=UPI001B86B93D|nr:uncharacterized protein DEU56DRAFT_917980 [Suillus clintonianus]KAG2121981.1 hypothetical protein DEU56DRAFT_917980 [Suillus clintonianus]